MPDPARNVIEEWIQAVNRRDLDRIATLYADDAVLLPTFSPHVLRTPGRRRAYFARLAEQPGLHVSLHEKTCSVQRAGGLDTASGIYCFRMEIDGEPLSFEARFSYVIDASSAHPILHHHSSQIPRNLS